MSKELIVPEQKALTVATTRDVLSTSLDIENLDNISNNDLCTMYKQVDSAEKVAIAMIKEQSDYKRGMYITALKTKNDDDWVGLVKRELNVGVKRAEALMLYYSKMTNLEPLLQLSQNSSDDSEKEDSATFKIQDLILPATEKHLSKLEGLTKDEKKELKKKLTPLLTKEILSNSNIKKSSKPFKKALASALKEAEVLADTLRKTENYTKAQSGEHSDAELLETFDKIGEVMENEADELTLGHKRLEKMREFGWSEDDELDYIKFLRLVDDTPNVAKFFKDNYDLYKSSYKELTSLLHPDKGVSPEAQTFLNAIGTEMKKLKDIHKYDDLVDKRGVVIQRYNDWKDELRMESLHMLDLNEIVDLVGRVSKTDD